MAKVTLERKESMKPRRHVKKGRGRRERGNHMQSSRVISIAGHGQESQDRQTRPQIGFRAKTGEQRQGKARFQEDNGETPNLTMKNPS